MIWSSNADHRQLRPANLLKKRLWDRCFPVNFPKFVKAAFFIEHLRLLLLTLALTHYYFAVTSLLVCDHCATTLPFHEWTLCCMNNMYDLWQVWIILSFSTFCNNMVNVMMAICNSRNVESGNRMRGWLECGESGQECGESG